MAHSGSSRFESLIDQQIRLAQERGEFDNLPGLGKPLPGAGRPDDELWWLRGYLAREGVSAEALLPTSLRLAREIERLPDTVADLPSEQMVRERVRDLNRQIAEYLRAPSGPHVPLRPVDADEMVEHWRAAHRTPATSAEVAHRDAATGGDRRRRRWWSGRRNAG